jgi:hypothetical protein
MKEPAQKYLSSIGVDLTRVAKRFVFILYKMNLFIDQYALDKKVTINRRMLIGAIHDYYVDTIRVKNFHKIKHTNVEKVYAYLAYWLLRRKPLQVIEEFNGCEFVNEVFIALFLSSAIASEKGISREQKEKNPTFKKFMDLLFYNLKYRPVSTQSLELMIEAFFSGCDFT